MWHSESRREASGAARRSLIIAAIVGGAVLQHLLVSAPPAAGVRPTPALHSPSTASNGANPAATAGHF